MFQGASSLTLDAKGRLTVPARHRGMLQTQGEGAVTLTRHPHGCLLLFPRLVWELHREKIVAWPMSARAWQRVFLGNAIDADLDSSGRILVSQELRSAVGINREVMMLGMGSHLEIWDVARMVENEAEAVAQGMPEVLVDFTF